MCVLLSCFLLEDEKGEINGTESIGFIVQSEMIPRTIMLKSET